MAYTLPEFARSRWLAFFAELTAKLTHHNVLIVIEGCVILKRLLVTQISVAALLQEGELLCNFIDMLIGSVQNERLFEPVVISLNEELTFVQLETLSVIVELMSRLYREDEPYYRLLVQARRGLLMDGVLHVMQSSHPHVYGIAAHLLASLLDMGPLVSLQVHSYDSTHYHKNAHNCRHSHRSCSPCKSSPFTVVHDKDASCDVYECDRNTKDVHVNQDRPCRTDASRMSSDDEGSHRNSSISSSSSSGKGSTCSTNSKRSSTNDMHRHRGEDDYCSCYYRDGVVCVRVGHNRPVRFSLPCHVSLASQMALRDHVTALCQQVSYQNRLMLAVVDRLTALVGSSEGPSRRAALSLRARALCHVRRLTPSCAAAPHLTETGAMGRSDAAPHASMSHTGEDDCPAARERSARPAPTHEAHEEADPHDDETEEYDEGCEKVKEEEDATQASSTHIDQQQTNDEDNKDDDGTIISNNDADNDNNKTTHNHNNEKVQPLEGEEEVVRATEALRALVDRTLTAIGTARSHAELLRGMSDVWCLTVAHPDAVSAAVTPTHIRTRVSRFLNTAPATRQDGLVFGVVLRWLGYCMMQTGANGCEGEGHDYTGPLAAAASRGSTTASNIHKTYKMHTNAGRVASGDTHDTRHALQYTAAAADDDTVCGRGRVRLRPETCEAVWQGPCVALLDMLHMGNDTDEEEELGKTRAADTSSTSTSPPTSAAPWHTRPFTVCAVAVPVWSFLSHACLPIVTTVSSQRAAPHRTTPSHEFAVAWRRVMTRALAHEGTLSSHNLSSSSSTTSSAREWVMMLDDAVYLERAMRVGASERVMWTYVACVSIAQALRTPLLTPTCFTKEKEGYMLVPAHRASSRLCHRRTLPEGADALRAVAAWTPRLVALVLHNPPPRVRRDEAAAAAAVTMPCGRHAESACATAVSASVLHAGSQPLGVVALMALDGCLSWLGQATECESAEGSHTRTVTVPAHDTCRPSAHMQAINDAFATVWREFDILERCTRWAAHTAVRGFVYRALCHGCRDKADATRIIRAAPSALSAAMRCVAQERQPAAVAAAALWLTHVRRWFAAKELGVGRGGICLDSAHSSSYSREREGQEEEREKAMQALMSVGFRQCVFARAAHMTHRQPARVRRVSAAVALWQLYVRLAECRCLPSRAQGHAAAEKANTEEAGADEGSVWAPHGYEASVRVWRRVLLLLTRVHEQGWHVPRASSSSSLHTITRAVTNTSTQSCVTDWFIWTSCVARGLTRMLRDDDAQSKGMCHELLTQSALPQLVAAVMAHPPPPCARSRRQPHTPPREPPREAMRVSTSDTMGATACLEHTCVHYTHEEDYLWCMRSYRVMMQEIAALIHSCRCYRRFMTHMYTTTAPSGRTPAVFWSRVCARVTDAAQPCRTRRAVALCLSAMLLPPCDTAKTDVVSYTNEDAEGKASWMTWAGGSSAVEKTSWMPVPRELSEHAAALLTALTHMDEVQRGRWARGGVSGKSHGCNLGQRTSVKDTSCREPMRRAGGGASCGRNDVYDAQDDEEEYDEPDDDEGEDESENDEECLSEEEEETRNWRRAVMLGWRALPCWLIYHTPAGHHWAHESGWLSERLTELERVMRITRDYLRGNGHAAGAEGGSSLRTSTRTRVAMLTALRVALSNVVSVVARENEGADEGGEEKEKAVFHAAVREGGRITQETEEAHTMAAHRTASQQRHDMNDTKKCNPDKSTDAKQSTCTAHAMHEFGHSSLSHDRAPLSSSSSSAAAAAAAAAKVHRIASVLCDGVSAPATRATTLQALRLCAYSAVGRRCLLHETQPAGTAESLSRSCLGRVLACVLGIATVWRRQAERGWSCTRSPSRCEQQQQRRRHTAMGSSSHAINVSTSSADDSPVGWEVLTIVCARGGSAVGRFILRHRGVERVMDVLQSTLSGAHATSSESAVWGRVLPPLRLLAALSFDAEAQGVMSRHETLIGHVIRWSSSSFSSSSSLSSSSTAASVCDSMCFSASATVSAVALLILRNLCFLPRRKTVMCQNRRVLQALWSAVTMSTSSSSSSCFALCSAAAENDMDGDAESSRTLLSAIEAVAHRARHEMLRQYARHPSRSSHRRSSLCMHDTNTRHEKDAQVGRACSEVGKERGRLSSVPNAVTCELRRSTTPALCLDKKNDEEEEGGEGAEMWCMDDEQVRNGWRCLCLRQRMAVSALAALLHEHHRGAVYIRALLTGEKQ